MSAACEIEFENSPLKIVYSGQLIKGFVIVKLRQEIVVRGIYLRFYSEAACEFKRKWFLRSVSVSGTEKYLDETITCLDETNVRTKTIRLEAGIHRYPFECQLMTLVPTSMEEKFGHIRYIASVYFHKNRDANAPAIHTELFTIIKPLNLNLLPDLQKPLAVENKQKFYHYCCLPCFKSGELTMTTIIRKRGFAPGESIHMQLDVHNKSSEEIGAIMVQIIKQLKYAGNCEELEHKLDRKYLTTLNGEILEGFRSSKEAMRSYRLALFVPSTAPSDEKTSGLIKISYKLRISAVVRVWHKQPVIEIPITIGTESIIGSNNSNLTSVIIHQSIAATSSRNDGADIPLLSKVPQ